MAKGNFSVRTNSDWNSLTYKFRESRNSKQLSLTIEEIKIPKNCWDKNLKKVKKNSKVDDLNKLNLRIKEFDLFIMNSYHKSILDGKKIDKEWLLVNYYSFFDLENPNKIQETPEFLLDFIKFQINQKKNDFSPNTIKGYNSTYNLLFDFEKTKKLKLNFKDFNLHMFEKLIEFCNNKRYNSSTIATYINKIKAIFKQAYEYELEVNDDYLLGKFKYKVTPKDYIYLNNDEITRISNLELTKFSMYDNARDWLLIGCYTGQRVSDLFNLENAVLNNNIYMHKNIKTGKEVLIPNSKKLQEILKKYEGNFPRKISDVKFNEYIKEVCKKAKINEIVRGSKLCKELINGKEEFRKIEGNYEKWELVTSHTCRRTLITKLMDEPLLKPHQIMVMTGHSDIKMLQRYNKIEKEKSVQALSDFI
ncbi:tyrosine-type recombinase/integrase [Empedobacter falsenii]|uniref:tyrosine-type recombinase/integrase n=1 Tax=Empedobacter falsenii TaxID=343874 RepID=UPI001C568D34|nr:site-specific integrase [Empedobacter falsenii]MBW1618154.1 site-specific integrase [Empedobacter falsenii]